MSKTQGTSGRGMARPQAVTVRPVDPPKPAAVATLVVRVLVLATAALTLWYTMLALLLLPMAFRDTDLNPESRASDGLLAGWALGLLFLFVAVFVVSRNFRWWVESLAISGLLVILWVGLHAVEYWARQPVEPFVDHMLESSALDGFLGLAGLAAGFVAIGAGFLAVVVIPVVSIAHLWERRRSRVQ